jgi:CBS domain-containing protein
MEVNGGYMSEEAIKPEIFVRDIMAKNPATLAANDTLDVAEHVMSLGGIRHMPVLRDGRLVGIISQRDLFRAPLALAFGYARKAQRRMTKITQVKEVMRKSVTTISPDSTISAAARQMMDKKIGCLPVMKANEIVGIVTETDILRHVAEHSPSSEPTLSLKGSIIADRNFLLNNSEP